MCGLRIASITFPPTPVVTRKPGDGWIPPERWAMLAPMFLALREMRRAKLRFGLLAGAVGLLVFLILFQQALLGGLNNQFIGALRHQSADVLVYSDQAREHLDGSIIFPDQAEQVGRVPGIGTATPLGEGSFNVSAGGVARDTIIFGYELGYAGEPTTLIKGRLPTATNEAVASEKDGADGYAATAHHRPLRVDVHRADHRRRTRQRDLAASCDEGRPGLGHRECIMRKRTK